MSVKDVAQRQNAKTVDTAAKLFGSLTAPKEGWVATVRKALGMSASHVAQRMGVTRAAIYQAERNERDGGISLKQMEKIAQSMGCKFVYAIVPDRRIEDVIYSQALDKATEITRRSNAHMALENQALPSSETDQEIKRLANQLARDMPSDFWKMS